MCAVLIYNAQGKTHGLTGGFTARSPALLHLGGKALMACRKSASQSGCLSPSHPRLPLKINAGRLVEVAALDEQLLPVVEQVWPGSDAVLRGYPAEPLADGQALGQGGAEGAKQEGQQQGAGRDRFRQVHHHWRVDGLVNGYPVSIYTRRVELLFCPNSSIFSTVATQGKSTSAKDGGFFLQHSCII
jgi:hypothetical protein